MTFVYFKQLCTDFETVFSLLHLRTHQRFNFRMHAFARVGKSFIEQPSEGYRHSPKCVTLRNCSTYALKPPPKTFLLSQYVTRGTAAGETGQWPTLRVELFVFFSPPSCLKLLNTPATNIAVALQLSGVTSDLSDSQARSTFQGGFTALTFNPQSAGSAKTRVSHPLLSLDRLGTSPPRLAENVEVLICCEAPLARQELRNVVIFELGRP